MNEIGSIASMPVFCGPMVSCFRYVWQLVMLNFMFGEKRLLFGRIMSILIF